MGWGNRIFQDDFTTVASDFNAFFASPDYSSRWEHWPASSDGPEMVAPGDSKVHVTLPSSTGMHTTGAVSKANQTLYNLDSNPNLLVGPSGAVERNRWTAVCDFYPVSRFSDGGVHLGIFLRFNNVGTDQITRFGCAIQTPSAYNCEASKALRGSCPGTGNVFLQLTGQPSQGASTVFTKTCCFTVTDVFNDASIKYRIQIEEWE